MKKSNSEHQAIYFSWFILASFFLYQYILRSAPGVLIDEIRVAFKLNADQFSLIGALYYLGYSMMQVPVGLLVDRKGIKNTALLSITLCLIGTLLFVITKNIIIAYFSRFMIGVGSASAFMCSVKLASDRFPKSKQGVAMGAVLAFGAIGALVTGMPLNYLLRKFSDWRDSFYIFILFGLILLLLVYIFIPKDENNKVLKTTNIWRDLKETLQNKVVLLYAFIAIGLFIPLSVMADLWGVGFLVRKFNLTREAASPILMNIYIGMAFGSIIIPLFINRFHINRVIQFCSIILLLLFSLLVYCSNISYNVLASLLIAIGFFCGSEMLCFSAALKKIDPSISGITIGVVNTLNMLSGAVMQQVIGFYLDFNWSGEVDSRGLRIYTTGDFIEAFSILVILMAICGIVALVFLKKNEE